MLCKFKIKKMVRVDIETPYQDVPHSVVEKVESEK